MKPLDTPSHQSSFPDCLPFSTSLISAPFGDNDLQTAQDPGPRGYSVTTCTRKAQPPQVLRPKVKGSCPQGTGPKRIGMWPWLI